MAATTTHPVDEVLSPDRLTALGIQHVLVMYAGAVAVPLIISGALGLTPEQIVVLDPLEPDRAGGHAPGR